jgi:hypothetical protein
LAAFLGATHSAVHVYCQIAPCVCRKWAAAEFVAEMAAGGALRDVVYGYARGALAAPARMTACNALHPIDQRAARWLLACHDRVGADEFTLTHEFLSVMLGVRRATVSATAGALQGAGLIAYKHGRVRVIDRPGLEAAACECYAAIRDAFATPGPPG